MHRDFVLHHLQIKDYLTSLLLEMVRRERNGEVVERTLIKNMCQMLVLLGINTRDVYHLNFEKPFLEESAEFYKLESQKFLAENSASVFINRVSPLCYLYTVCYAKPAR